MLTFIKTDSNDLDFQSLIHLLDVELNERYNRPLDFLNPTNAIPFCKTVLLVKKEGIFVGCGCFKEFKKDTVELKRIFVKEEFRNAGIAYQIVRQLESWAINLGFLKLILETGIHQPEAIRLYEKLNYRRIEKFPPYMGNDLSVCMGKGLKNN